MLLFLDRRENKIKINGDKYQEIIDIFVIKGRYFLFLFLFLYNFYHFEKRHPNLKKIIWNDKKNSHSNKRFLIYQILVNLNLPLYDLEYVHGVRLHGLSFFVCFACACAGMSTGKDTQLFISVLMVYFFTFSLLLSSIYHNIFFFLWPKH